MTCLPPIADQLMTFGAIVWHINGTNLYLTGPLVRAGKSLCVSECVCGLLLHQLSSLPWKPNLQMWMCRSVSPKQDSSSPHTACVCFLFPNSHCLSRTFDVGAFVHPAPVLVKLIYTVSTPSAVVMSHQSLQTVHLSLSVSTLCVLVCVCVSLIHSLTALSDFCTSSSH